jgi:hypothetical protein
MNTLKIIGVLVYVLFTSPVPIGAADNGKVIYFDQPESAQLFQDAATKSSFWTLARYFVSEKIDTFCGVASSVMVLNALDAPAPISPFIYPYRKFDQDNFFNPTVLEVKPADRIGANGLTLEQLSAILKSFGVTVETHHADTVSLDQFRELAMTALESKERYLVVNFLRTALDQVGGGHISPLAAYHKPSDRFLVLDVARYKYPPAWVKAEDLWRAMNTEDADAKAKRGFVIVSRAQQ